MKDVEESTLLQKNQLEGSSEMTMKKQLQKEKKIKAFEYKKRKINRHLKEKFRKSDHDTDNVIIERTIC